VAVCDIPDMTNPLALDPRTTALVLIDLQKGIVARELAPHNAAKVLQNAHDLGRRFNDTGGLVVLVHVAFAADAADRLRQPVDAPMPVPPGGLPADWADFVPEIADIRAGVVITKRQWSAFHGTELDLQLRRRGVSSIVLGGISTNFGVESTARDAWQHGYQVVIAEDACTSTGSGLHEFAIEKILPRVARVRGTADVLAGLLDPH
jgi:nicotinamidase-related amidase